MTDALLKLLSPTQVVAILDHGSSTIGGPIVRAEQLRSSDPAVVQDAWGWAERAPYGTLPPHVDVLRLPLRPLMRLRTPDPSVSTGFLPTSGGEVVPVFDLAPTRVPTGTELWRLRADGDPGLKMIFDGPALGWRQAPSYYPPLHVVGPRVQWQGLDLPAAFTADPEVVEAVQVGGDAPPGFETVRPQIHRGYVPIAACERVFEVELTGSWRGREVRVLQRAADQALVQLHASGGALDGDLTAETVEVEPGILEATVPYDDLTDVGGSTYERDGS